MSAVILPAVGLLCGIAARVDAQRDVALLQISGCIRFAKRAATSCNAWCRPSRSAASLSSSARRGARSRVAFWNIAPIEDDDARASEVDELVARFEADDPRDRFRPLADAMLRRHREMFPELHARGGL